MSTSDKYESMDGGGYVPSKGAGANIQMGYIPPPQPDTEGMTEVQKRVDDIKEQIDENLRLTSRIPYNTTPDTKWSVEELMCDLRYLASPYAETLSDMQRTSLFILLVNRLDKVLSSRDTTPDTEWDTRIIDGVQYVHGKRVAQLLSSRDTYWKERMRNEVDKIDQDDYGAVENILRFKIKAELLQALDNLK